MADEAKDDAKKGGPIAQIATGVVMAILVGGTAPWWFHEFFKKQVPQAPAPIIEGNKPVAPPMESVVTPPKDTVPEVSREFFVGRWRLEQTVGPFSESNNIDYYENGKMDGQVLDVAGGAGRRVHLVGTWEVEKLSKTMFLLTTQSNMGEFSGKYKIIDKNHVQNLDSNYVAERVE